MAFFLYWLGVALIGGMVGQFCFLFLPTEIATGVAFLLGVVIGWVAMEYYWKIK